MEFESAERCTAAAFTRSGTHIAAGYHNGMQRLFDLDAVNIRWTATHHSAPVVGVASDRDSGQLLAVARDGVLSVTACRDGSLQRTANALVKAVHGHPISAFAASPVDAALAAVAWRRGAVVFAAPWRGKDLHIVAKHETTPSVDILEVCCPVLAPPEMIRHCRIALALLRRALVSWTALRLDCKALQGSGGDLA